MNGLEQALARVGDLVMADIHFQPFELNPDMPLEGQNIREHVAQKYGSTPEQSTSARAMIRDRAASVGFTMAMKDDSRIYNTFDAHRLLHWAGLTGKQGELKHALFDAYFTDGRNPSDHGVLVKAVEAAGLDPDAAREVLETNAYAKEVREAEKFWHGQGVSAVPGRDHQRQIHDFGRPAAGDVRARHPQHRRRDGSARGVVGGFQPGPQFGVDVFGLVDLQPVGEHGVETARRFQPTFWRMIFQDQAEVDTGLGTGLDQGELLLAADADVSLLRRDLHIRAEALRRCDELVVEGSQTLLAALEQMLDGIVR